MVLLYLALQLFPDTHAQLAGSSTYAQAGQALGQSTVSQCLEDSNCTSIPAEALSLALTPTQTCTNANTPQPIVTKDDEGNTKQVEVLLSVEVHVDPSQAGTHSSNRYIFDQYGSNMIDNTIPSSAMNDWSQLKNWAKTSDWVGHPEYQRSTFVEGLVYAASKSNLSEDDLAKNMAAAIQNYSPDEQERLALFATLSDRLYSNYNDLRNPEMNSGHIDSKNISLNQMVGAAATWNESKGGVCNDISQSVSLVGKHLFPDADSLVFNNGSHFGNIIQFKGKPPTILSWGELTTNKTQISLDPAIQVTSTRIYKNENGTLKQIAMMDTETGAVLKRFYTETAPTLLTGAQPSTAAVKFKDEYTTKHGATKTLTGTVGTAKTSESMMIIFMGESVTKKGNSTNSTAIGTSFQNVSAIGQQDVVFSFHKTYDHTLFTYVSPRVRLNTSGGGQYDGSYTAITQKGVSEYYGVGTYSQTFMLNQKATLQTTPKNPMNPSYQGSASAYQVLGRGNEGAATSYESNSSPIGTLQGLRYTNLFVNELDVNNQLTIPLQSNKNLSFNANYRGTPVAQTFNFSSGLTLQSKGTFQQVYFMVGFSQTTGGFKTQNPLIMDPSGGQAKAQVTLKNGMQGSAGVTGIGSSQPIAQVTLNATLFARKKKLMPPAY